MGWYRIHGIPCGPCDHISIAASGRTGQVRIKELFFFLSPKHLSSVKRDIEPPFFLADWTVSQCEGTVLLVHY